MAKNKELGDKSLAKSLASASQMLRGLIPIAGVDVIREQFINGMGDEFRRTVEEKPLFTVDELISDALDSPDFMDLLKALDMGEKDLRLFASEALKQ